MGTFKNISDDFKVYGGDDYVRVEVDPFMESMASCILSVVEVEELKSFCEEFLRGAREKEGRARAKEAGEEYCVECNGPRTRKGAFYEGDEED
jgi:hypothetical protein